MSTSGVAVAILDFRLSVTSDCVRDIAVEFRDTENMGIAVEISLLCCTEPEIAWGYFFTTWLLKWGVKIWLLHVGKVLASLFTAFFMLLDTAWVRMQHVYGTVFGLRHVYNHDIIPPEAIAWRNYKNARLRVLAIRFVIIAIIIGRRATMLSQTLAFASFGIFTKAYNTPLAHYAITKRWDAINAIQVYNMVLLYMLVTSVSTRATWNQL